LPIFIRDWRWVFPPHDESTSYATTRFAILDRKCRPRKNVDNSNATQQVGTAG